MKIQTKMIWRLYLGIGIVSIMILTGISLYSQSDDIYKDTYLKKDYKQALEQIISRIDEIYKARVNEKRIPEDYLSIDSRRSKIDLVALYRNRKERGFFIEDNPELAELHLYAGHCFFKLGKKNDSLNHYIQSLRFRKITTERDDELFYSISQVFKSMDSKVYFNGYIDALEQAYSLNNSKYEYSYELGMALFSTVDKKKSIYHLERYLNNSHQKDAEVILKLANLYESIGRYIECEKYYNEYIREKPEDINALFAAGYIAYFRTGNYTLAEFMFLGVLNKSQENNLYLKAKSNEYLGDMALSSLKYNDAISYYNNSIGYYNKIELEITDKEKEKNEIDKKINNVKVNLLNNKDALVYAEYESFLDDYEGLLNEKGEKESELQKLHYILKQLNPGKVQWNMAEAFEKRGAYGEAIRFYKEAIRYNYNTENARYIVDKLQLKIKRGY